MIYTIYYFIYLKYGDNIQKVNAVLEDYENF